jgi:hypothetical protein
MELFSKIRGFPWKFVDCGLILKKNRGLHAKWRGFLDFRFIFQWKIWWTGSTARLGPVMDRGGMDMRVRWCLAGAWRAGARAHRFSLVEAEEDEPDEVAPKGCSPEHEQRRRGGASAKKTSSGSSSVGEWRRAQKAWKREGEEVRE